MSNFQRDSYNMNSIQSQFSILSVYGPIIEDNINLYRNYNMLVKQENSKAQTCASLKVKRVQLIVLEKAVTYNLLIILCRKEKAKKETRYRIQ